jgi:amino acid transporter/nucleotide-binding universal stress UspA family protein
LKKGKESEFLRELSFNQALSIGLGTMIGAGIFVLSAIAAERAGPGATFSYLLAGLVCLPIAMTISELATGMPKAGGSYYLISRALGPMAGAIVGLGNWLGLTFATGFYLIGFGQYVAYFLPLPSWSIALAASAFFIYLNYRGAKLSGQLQNIIVLLLVLILAVFVARGVFNVDPLLHRPFIPFGWGVVIANVGLIIVSFTGFENISTLAEEIKRPERNLPLAIVGSVLIATFLYAGILYVATGILPYEVIADSKAPLVEVASRFMSAIGIAGISLAALLATASSANAAIMASSRINFAMGRDSILPGWFNRIHERYMTPHRSVVITGVLAMLLALSGKAATLAEISSALFMVSYALLSLSVIVMHKARPAWYRPAYRAPLYPWLSAAGGLLASSVIGTMERTSQIAGMALIALSLAWYAIWGKRRTDVEGELLPWLQRERPLEDVISHMERAIQARRKEILVPVANPATAKSLITLAAKLARSYEGTRVVALKVVPVPVHIPLSIAQDYLERRGEEHRDVLRRAAKHGAVAGVRVKMLLKATRGVASGILGVARSRSETRMILLGWHGPFLRELIDFGKKIDKEVVRNAHCDVGVFLDRNSRDISHILVPVGGGPHARLGLRLGYQLAMGEDAELAALRIAKGADLAAEEEALKRLVKNELGKADERVKLRIVQSRSVVKGILEEARKGSYDFLIIGASEEWFFRKWLFGAIPDAVAERAPCSVLLVRKYEPSPIPWLRRALRRARV